MKVKGGCWVGSCELTHWGVAQPDSDRQSRAEQHGVGLLHVQFMCNALPMLLFCCCYLHSHAPSQHYGHKLLIVCLIFEYIRHGVAVLSLCLYLACVLFLAAALGSARSWGINIFSSNISRHYWNCCCYCSLAVAKFKRIKRRSSARRGEEGGRRLLKFM